MSQPNILTLAASFRSDSLNKELLAIASGELARTARLTELDYEQLDAPNYKGVDGALPKGAKLFADALLKHEGLVLAAPEYNWSIPGGLKNLIDWLSVDRREPLKGKVALLMCASTSSRGGVSGLQHLRITLQVLGCWVYPHVISIGTAKEQMHGGKLVNPKEQQYLAECIHDFVRATEALHA